MMTTSVSQNAVFLASGRDHVARGALRRLIERFGVAVLDWETSISLTGKGSPYAWEVIETGFKNARGFVILLTGDEEARLRKHLCKADEYKAEGILQPQPRPNVLFEAGIAMAMGRERTLLVQLGRLRGFSDIAGMQVLVLDESRESKEALARRLSSVGCTVKLNDQTLSFVEDVPTSDTGLATFKPTGSIHRVSVALVRRLHSILPFASMGGRTEIVRDAYIGETLDLSVRLPEPEIPEMKLSLLHFPPGRIDGTAIPIPEPQGEKQTREVAFSMPGPAGIHVIDLVACGTLDDEEGKVVVRYKCVARESP